jgi:hypothetical protein
MVIRGLPSGRRDGKHTRKAAAARSRRPLLQIPEQERSVLIHNDHLTDQDEAEWMSSD